MSKRPNTTIFMGCIGKGKYGEILKDKAEAVGVSVHYQYHDKEATGTAACLISGTDRCVHVADLFVCSPNDCQGRRVCLVHMITISCSQ